MWLYMNVGDDHVSSSRSKKGYIVPAPRPAGAETSPASSFSQPSPFLLARPPLNFFTHPKIFTRDVEKQKQELMDLFRLYDDISPPVAIF
jgi:hypothetical protein